MKRPKLLSHLTLGFNKSTQALEAQTSEIYIPASYATARTTAKQKKPLKNPIVALFVARQDIEPAILLSHFPLLTLTSSPRVKLVQLPRSAMACLSDASGIAELGVVGVRSDCPDSAMLFQALEKVDFASSAWASSREDQATSRYQALNVKQLMTSMPVTPKK